MREAIVAPGAPPPVGYVSHPVTAGESHYVSGQVLRDGTGVHERAEVETSMTSTNLATMASVGGGRSANAVKIDMYLADRGYSAAFNATYADFFDATPPARTVVVAGLHNGKIQLDAVIDLGPTE